MLDTIRRHQQSWLTYLIFIAIIVVFAVNFGPGSSSCRGVAGTTYAAMVDDDIIRQQDFAMRYSSRLESMRRRFAGSNMELTAELADKMGLRAQVIDQLVEMKLLAHEAERRGLTISDDELRKTLEDVYRVKEMTAEQYRNMVERNFQSTVARFEDDVREELLAQKMQRLVTENVGVSDAELQTEYLREHDRAMIDYVKIDVTTQGIEPTAAEIDTLLAAEPKAVEERYNLDSLKYRTAEQRQARQIMLKLPPNATDAEVAKAKSKLNELKGKIEGGADFAAIAKEASEDDVSKASGGDLGLIKRGTLPKPVEDAIFTQKPQELSSEPVRSINGLHLIQVTEIKPPEKRPLKEVEREVATSVLRDRAADAKAKSEADALLGALKGGKTLAELTMSEEEAKAATQPPAAGAAPQPAAPGKPLRHESPWIVKQEQALPGIGLSPELHQEIFSLTKEAPVVKSAYKVGKAYYVVVLKDRETPDLTKFASEKSTLREQATWQKRREVMDEWMKHLRSQARVELNPALFGKGGNGEQEPSDSDNG